jgi:hypothetical protein
MDANALVKGLASMMILINTVLVVAFPMSWPDDKELRFAPIIAIVLLLLVMFL